MVSGCGAKLEVPKNDASLPWCPSPDPSRRSPGSEPIPGRAMQRWGVAAPHPTHSHSSHSAVPVALADVPELLGARGTCRVSQESPYSVQ